MPAEEPMSPELAAVTARFAPFMVRIAHGRRKGSTEWLSTGCAFGLDGCRESDCGCKCHTRFSDIGSEEGSNER